MYITVRDKEKWDAAWETPIIMDYKCTEIVDYQSIIRIKFNRLLRKDNLLATHQFSNPPLLVFDKEDEWNLCRFATSNSLFKSEVSRWITHPVSLRYLGNWIYEEGIAYGNSGITYS